MPKRNYPTPWTDWYLVSTDNWIGFVGKFCRQCPHQFGKDEKFWKRERQISWMRGDDQVEGICIACKAKADA